MLNRRDFHKGLSATVLAVLGARPVGAANVPGDPDTIFLNRLTHGATAAERGELARLGRAGWLDMQLALPPHDDGLSARLAAARLRIEYEEGTAENGETWPAVDEWRAMTWLDAAPEALVQLIDWDRPIAYSERERPAIEVIAASLTRAVHAPAQLREVMTQFWHDHFSVNAPKDELTAALFPAYDRSLREHALGNFRVLLGATATSPVMLHYLNNDESFASPANENYARELLELHTLGQENYLNDLYDDWREVPGARAGLAQGYIDDDVYEVARALTGWSIGDGREYGDDGDKTPWSGQLAYIEAWHDPYQKRVLGVELDAYSAPMADGLKVLDILATHPGTARFVTRKMIRRLGVEDPSHDFAAEIAQVFMDNAEAPDQIARVVRAIALHPEFGAAPARKLRRPFEFLAALYRTTGAQVSPRDGTPDWLLSEAGWAQHQVRPPTGHSDETVDWADTRTIKGMLTLALEAHYDWFEASDRVLATAPEGVRDYGGLAAHFATLFGIDREVFRPILDQYETDDDDPLPDDPDELEWAASLLVAHAALGPEFLFR